MRPEGAWSMSTVGLTAQEISFPIENPFLRGSYCHSMAGSKPTWSDRHVLDKWVLWCTSLKKDFRKGCACHVEVAWFRLVLHFLLISKCHISVMKHCCSEMSFFFSSSFYFSMDRANIDHSYRAQQKGQPPSYESKLNIFISFSVFFVQDVPFKLHKCCIAWILSLFVISHTGHIVVTLIL